MAVVIAAAGVAAGGTITLAQAVKIHVLIANPPIGPAVDPAAPI